MKRKMCKKVVCMTLATAVGLASLGSYLCQNEDEFHAIATETSFREKTPKERLYEKEKPEAVQVNVDTSGKKNEKVRLIVTLDYYAAAEVLGVGEYTEEVQKLEEYVIKEQQTEVGKIEKITGNKVENRTGYLVNGFAVNATREQAYKIAKVAGVEAIYESKRYVEYVEDVNYESVEYTDKMIDVVENSENEEQLIIDEDLYTGAGTVVAVIDSCVNYTHSDMCLDKTVEPKFDKNEWCEKIKLLKRGAYKTDKVPFAYNYVDGINDCMTGLDKSKSNIHGGNMAGVVAANGKVRGVAKNAQILGLQVINNANSTVYSYSDTIVKAIEDAVKLDADIINMSLANESIVMRDREYVQRAVNNATDMGVINCITIVNANISANQIYESVNVNKTLNKDTVDDGFVVTSVEKDVTKLGKTDQEVYNKSFNLCKRKIYELSIEPEISVLSERVKLPDTGKINYSVKNGASLSSSFIAGCTAVLLNATKEKGVYLENKALYRYLKNNLMNTATILKNPKTGIPYSLRYQGAGLVNLFGAIENCVTATYKDEAKVELGKVLANNKGKHEFNIELRNYGFESMTYELKNCQLYIESIDENSNTYGLKKIDGCYVEFDTEEQYKTNRITVLPGEVISLKAAIVFPKNMSKNTFVEGYIVFEGDKVAKNQDVSLPILAYYTDK